MTIEYPFLGTVHIATVHKILAQPAGANVTGTRTLANATMETFKQRLNCFVCHSGDMLGDKDGGGLSHIWGQILPLFP